MGRAGEKKLLKQGNVKRLAIYASKVIARVPMVSRDGLLGTPRTTNEVFAQLYTDVDTPIHQLFFSVELDVWMEPMFEAHEPPEHKTLKTYLRRGGESIVDLAAKEPYSHVIEKA